MHFLRTLLSPSRIKRLPHTVECSPMEIDVVALAASPLGKLPVEIILYITTYLSIAQAAVFSISCKQIQILIGNQYLAQLAVRVKLSDTWEFLSLMAIDRLDQIVCHICQKPHAMKDAERYCPAKWAAFKLPVAKCVTEHILWGSGGKSLDKLLSPSFSTPVFQMAMKLSQNHLPCEHLLQLLSGGRTTKLPCAWDEDWVAQRKAECRIVQGRMLHRSQEVYLAAPNSECCFHEVVVTLCKHLSFRADEFSIRVEVKKKEGNSRSIKWEIGRDFLRSGASSGVMQCECCWTDFRIDFKNYARKRMAMFYTRWSDLGTGPSGKQWMAKVHGLPGRDDPLEDEENKTLCDVFEGDNKFRIGEIITKRKDRKELFKIQELHFINQAKTREEYLRDRRLIFEHWNAGINFPDIQGRYPY